MMNPTDFSFYYQTEEYTRSDNFLSNHGLSGEGVQFLTALLGINNSSKIALDNRPNGEVKKRSLSRTVYQRAMVEMDRDFGLLTIIDSLNEPYTEVLNKKAFLKNTNGERYFELPNVSTFYQYFLGGIEYVDEIIFQYGDKEEDIFDSIYEYLTDKENKQIMDDFIDELGGEIDEPRI
ncbi:hypothetical protein FD49_GL001316 [Latilactobacillus sakei subsp. sakei DSM 20017 = JCM 1157]|nr:hypothetical protein FD49_GL001316 [Latilactobacillus sakei subsp. sakei DSM 20017 = JCM 1157]